VVLLRSLAHVVVSLALMETFPPPLPQTITTTCSVGSIMGGSFYIQLDTSATGGSLQLSGQ